MAAIKLTWAVPRWSYVPRLWRELHAVVNARSLIRISAASIVGCAALVGAFKIMIPNLALGNLWLMVFALPGILFSLIVQMAIHSVVPPFVTVRNDRVHYSHGQSGSIVKAYQIENIRLTVFGDSKIRLKIRFCNGDPAGCEDCMEQLEDYLPDDPASLACAIPTDWYCVGCKADVPRDACFVGCHQNKYVWVTPQGMEGLSRFTLTIMQLATTEVTTDTKTVLKKYDADDKLQSTEITTTESDEETKRTVHSEIQTDDSSNVTQPQSSFPRSHRSSPLSPKQIRKRPGLSNLLSPRLGGP